MNTKTKELINKLESRSQKQERRRKLLKAFGVAEWNNPVTRASIIEALNNTK